MEKTRLHSIRLMMACLLFCALSVLGSRSAKAAKYVSKSDTTVSITSKQTGWVKKNGDWYFYDTSGRLCYGSIKYKGKYYYSAKDGKRVTGIVVRSGVRYYYSKKSGYLLYNYWLTTKKGNKYYIDGSGHLLTSEWLTLNGKTYYFNSNSRMVKGMKTIGGSRYYFNSNGVMYSSKWLTKSGKKYYFKSSGKAVTSGWLTKSGKKYYFDSKSVMVTGWNKIKGYYYYFDSDGVLATSKWVGIYYVNAKGQRTSKTRSVTTVNTAKTKYTYKSSTLNIVLEKKNWHYSDADISYWVAQVKTSDSSQVKSALSYGTYGGTRQTTSSAVSSNGGIIGINGSGFSYSTGTPFPDSMCIKNGIVYADHMTGDNIMCIKEDGTMYVASVGQTAADLLEAGVKNTFVFGPALISNGEVVYSTRASASEVAGRYPRAAVGMISKNKYVLLVTNTGTYDGLDGAAMASIFKSYGCKFAYNLDGGGSVTLYFNGQVMNELISDYERPVADYLYFTK
ncbi:MAG: phosphodiester glycosidase family protein [Lachnospiraceae bacterium]|nr:phosphodiester glycosidase family protein [Lachnospiraceae bacterium]